MSKITLQNIYECYEYGKKIAENNFDIGTAVKIIAKNGMDIGSSRIYIRCVISMISGERYTGAVNEMAVTHFLTSILTDYGLAVLRKALRQYRTILMVLP